MPEEVSNNYRRLVFAIRNAEGFAKSKSSGIEYDICAACFEHKDHFSLVLQFLQKDEIFQMSKPVLFYSIQLLLQNLKKALLNFEFISQAVILFDKGYGIDFEDECIRKWTEDVVSG